MGASSPNLPEAELPRSQLHEHLVFLDKRRLNVMTKVQYVGKLKKFIY
jgi:hypothetical protein